MTRAPLSANNPSASSRLEGRAYMRPAHTSDVCMQMILWNRRLVKDPLAFYAREARIPPISELETPCAEPRLATLERLGDECDDVGHDRRRRLIHRRRDVWSVSRRNR